MLYNIGKGGETMDDELMIELDDLDLEKPTVGGKIATVLPLSVPMTPTLPTAIDYRGELELTKDAKALFDFSKTGLSPLQQLYILGFAVRGTRTGACRLAGIPYKVVDKWAENDEFNEALQNAVDTVRDSLEEELLARAMNGSDKLLLEAVKAMKPEKYNKKQADVNINGTMVHTWADLARQAISVGSSAPAIDVSYTEEDE